MNAFLIVYNAIISIFNLMFSVNEILTCKSVLLLLSICNITLFPQQYAIVFDAGSTHTSMFVYEWDGAKLKGTAVVRQLGETCDAKGFFVRKAYQ